MNAGLKEQCLRAGYRGPSVNIYRTRGYQVSAGARALAEWMEAGVRRGYSLYYINFMFDNLRGRRDAILQQMRTSIHRGF